jgi:hypothetical protein
MMGAPANRPCDSSVGRAANKLLGGWIGFAIVYLPLSDRTRFEDWTPS